jgi:ribosomal protein S18 acetylase RimI-like enzyme
MPDAFTIRPIAEHDEDRARALLKSMYPSVDEADFEARLRRMREEDGYALHGLCEDGALLGVVGFIRLTNLIYGDYVWVHDLVVDEAHRGCGLGTRLMEHVSALAAAEGRNYVALAAFRSAHEAQRFYEEHLGYERRGVVFRGPTRPDDEQDDTGQA